MNRNSLLSEYGHIHTASMIFTRDENNNFTLPSQSAILIDNIATSVAFISTIANKSVLFSVIKQICWQFLFVNCEVVFYIIKFRIFKQLCTIQYIDISYLKR